MVRLDNLGESVMDAVETVLFEMVQDSTFGVNPESNRIDVRAAGEFASCYGVNLAFAAFGCGLFLQVVKVGSWYGTLLFASCEVRPRNGRAHSLQHCTPFNTCF
jgi:hypothetical protein